MARDVLSITVKELEALLSKMKANDRFGGTVDIKVNATTSEFVVWEIDKEEGLR